MDPDGSNLPAGLIGGIGLTEVHVYAQRHAPDGQYSGCPHVHAVTDEGYFILRGSGAVEFHDLKHGYRKMDLQTGQYVHFPPLVMHRLISDGDLVVLGMMGNAGLAERGEARIYFGREVDEDPQHFAELQSLPHRLGLDGALDRRDASVKAYGRLMRLWPDNKQAYFDELRRFFGVHCDAMSKRADALAAEVDNGPIAWAQATKHRLRQLPDFASVPGEVFLNRPAGEAALGMCGVLRTIQKLERFA